MSAKTMEDIAAQLKAVKFKKKLFGGVDEDDVWRVLERMQAEYRSIVEATELRFGALLDERNDMICKQAARLSQLQPKQVSTGGDDGDG